MWLWFRNLVLFFFEHRSGSFRILSSIQKPMESQPMTPCYLHCIERRMHGDLYLVIVFSQGFRFSTSRPVKCGQFGRILSRNRILVSVSIFDFLTYSMRPIWSHPATTLLFLILQINTGHRQLFKFISQNSCPDIVSRKLLSALCR